MNLPNGCLRSGAVPEPDGEHNQPVFSDIDLMLGAALARLALTVDDGFLGGAASRLGGDVRRTPADVLDCLADLEHLHATVAADADRCRQTIADLRRELAAAQADLAVTRAGERQARYLALHDSLTLLPNGSFFRGGLDHALAQPNGEPQPVAVVYLDLDGFKKINDRYGHGTGDALLCIVAARLTGAIRAEDLVCRVGGDEFACLLAGVPDQRQVSHLVCKLFDAVAGPLKIEGRAMTIRPSIGVAMYPGDGTTSDSLLRNADAAMYRAKREKRGYAFFDERADVWFHETAHPASIQIN